ncbi:Prefoldin subunit 5 [Candida viswanathii]|uniref:Prefoldin subunit 5 n=1 Tax=Candida viswanathii TaxID=5486 RepID=A0A367Y500_9ASCO|nr:Prefoldin subunit 5 [Candida viswanathii]
MSATATAAAAPQATPIDLNSLGPQQLVEFRKSIDQEISHFTQSLQALSTAQSKLKECIASIDNLEKSKEDSLLVPLTSSLYIPGQIVSRNDYLVDIGTGYYVEKTADNAKVVYDNKIKKLDEDAKKLKGILVQKNELLNTVNLILRKKVIEMEKQQEGAAKAS